MKYLTNRFFIGIYIISSALACSKPIDQIKNKTWSGKIYRAEDRKELSEVKLKFSNDTLYLFSNAIFGAENDTLLIIESDQYHNDSILLIQSINSKESDNYFSDVLIYKYEKKDVHDRLVITGCDFYITLVQDINDIFAPNALTFYKSIKVPKLAYMYLEGAYEGESEFENDILNLFSMLSFANAKVKFIFLDDFRVKVFGSLSFFSGVDIFNYTVIGNSIFLGKEKKEWRVVDNGRKIVLQTEKLNITLQKIY